MIKYLVKSNNNQYLCGMNEKTIDKIKGGKRDGAGRKPTDDPKLPITVYIEKSRVEKNGGRAELSKKIHETVACDFLINPILERDNQLINAARGRDKSGINEDESKRAIISRKSQVSISEDAPKHQVIPIGQGNIQNVFTETKEDKIAKLEGEIALLGKGTLGEKMKKVLQAKIEKIRYEQ